MAGSTAYVKGLDQFVRSVGRVDKGAVRQIRKELRVGVGGRFVKDVKARISANGLVDSGRLRGSIRPAVKGSTLIIRSKPQKPGKRSPEGYNAVYEFGGSVVRSVRLKGGGRGFSAVVNRSGQGAALAAGGAAQGSLGEFGPRAFLFPTAEEWNSGGKTEQAFEGFLEWIERTYAA